jgi:hypothetical protein
MGVSRPHAAAFIVGNDAMDTRIKLYSEKRVWQLSFGIIRLEQRVLDGR